MRGNILNKLVIALGLLAIVSCKAKKLAVIGPKTTDSNAKKVAVSENKIHAIRSAQLSFNTFSGRAKTNLDINGSSNNVTLNIHINKGQKIWVSVTAIAGIEVARAVITPDSLLVVNKLQGLYLRQPFSYIYKYAGSQLDYNSVEALLVGNAIPQLLTDQVYMKADSTNLDIRGTLNELVYNLVVGPDMRARSTSLIDQGAGQSLYVNDSAFTQVADKFLPSQIDINSIVGTKKVKMSMRYIKVDFDKPLEYPFSIPDDYSPAR